MTSWSEPKESKAGVNEKINNNIWSFLRTLQEPQDSDFGILILNQPILSDPKLIESLWNRAALRGLVDGGSNRWFDFLQKYNSHDLKLPDFFSGDFDSVKPEAKAHFENLDVKVISTPNQDETDFTKALRCIADFIKAKHLNIKLVFAVCENSGRFDQIIGNINTLHFSNRILKDIPVIILSSQNIVWVLHPGKHIIYVPDDYIKKEYNCGLIPFCRPTITKTSGLKWDLENHVLQIGDLISTSNTFKSNTINISCEQDLVWTTQYSDIDH